MLNYRKIVLLIISIILTVAFSSVAYAAENNAKPSITYIKASSPANTAIAISQKAWSQSDNVILADSSKFADPLAGSSFAMIKDAPILYKEGSPLLDLQNEHTKWDELVRLKAKRVYILGGIAAVPKSMEEELKTKGMEVIRLSGSDRFETAKVIGDEVIKINNSGTVFLTYANDFPDALSVATFAGQLKAPIMFTDKDSLNSTTQNALKEWNTKTVYIAGGTGVISQKVEDTLISQGIKVIRLGGKNRYETAENIIKHFKPNVDSMILTTGISFYNALVGSVYGYKTNQPVMLFDGRVDESIKEFAWGCRDLLCLGSTFSEYTIKPLPKPIKPGGFVNTSGGGDVRDAGVFGTPDNKLVTINKSADYETNLRQIHSMIGPTYGTRYTPKMTIDGVNFIGIQFMYDKAANRYGLKISEWRDSYDSDVGQNNLCNSVLETFYALCGDREVAYALWSWIDASALKGYANSDDFGFKDVSVHENGGVVVLNGVEIDYTNYKGVTTVYFK